MAARLLLPLAFLIVQVSCGQNSLTFVIDNSPSMTSEISQVKDAAKSIVDIVLKEKSSQIEDIVLVTFRNGDEPKARLREKTRDETQLKRALDSIRIERALCLEVALTGIKKGLEESRHGSYVFVFTDTSSEDYGKFTEIKTLCQEKQSQVVIILTGNTCVEESGEGYQVYYKIATACSGQVFLIEKEETNKVLDFVKETIKGDRTVLTTRTVPPSTWENIDFNVDDQTEYAIVSASGTAVELLVYDKTNHRSQEIYGTHITWTHNVKITKLTDLVPGTYTARVKGNSQVSIVVYGRTDFNFQHGFSTAVQTNLKATDTQPTTAVETLLMVSVQDKKHSALIQEVHLLGMDDHVIMRLPLTNVQGDIYKTEMFLSPETTFKIAVVAKSRTTGSTVTRIAKTPVTPIQSVAPAISKTEKILKVKEGASVDVHCRIIAGKPWPQISWYVRKQGETGFSPLQGTDVVYHVARALTNDQYKCVAKNVKDEDEHVVTLDLQSRPRIVFVPPNSPEYSGVEGDVVMRLPCAAAGYPTPTITWKVDNHVIPRDKSKELYVENNTLFLRNPKEIHSSSKSHSYICHAKNDFGEATQPYQVYISKYVNTDNVNGSHYGSLEKPYDFACPLPYTDPNSVRWYKNYTSYSTGPSLHFDHPTDADSGNYTCRVSDLNGAASHTVEVIFGSPPNRDQTLFNINWIGEKTKKINCFSNELPLGKYDWFYNGKKIEGAHTQSLLPIGWGQYICQITHPLGNLTLNFQVKTKNKECGIPTSFLKTEHAPLVLDSSLEWPLMPISGQYLIMPNSEKLQLICQDEKSLTKAVQPTNSFIKFPTMKSVYATCDKEDYFLVDGVSQKISELNCKNSVTPSVLNTGKQCLGDNTELMQVGFYVNGFTDVYQSCVDSMKKVPLYTKMNTIEVKKESRETVTSVKSSCERECCYEKIQLVNAVDVSFGPAEKATFMDSLNSLNYCKPKNISYTNWFDIEKISRDRADTEQFTVWSGAANYSKVGGAWTPKYLWKVMASLGQSEKMVVIHENTGIAGAKLCNGECSKDGDIWFEPAGERTYCCSLDDFKKAFGLNVDFN